MYMRNSVIDGSTDRCCIAVVTNERALFSGSDQPVQNLGRRRILCMSGGKKLSKTATFLHCQYRQRIRTKQ